MRSSAVLGAVPGRCCVSVCASSRDVSECSSFALRLFLLLLGSCTVGTTKCLWNCDGEARQNRALCELLKVTGENTSLDPAECAMPTAAPCHSTKNVSVRTVSAVKRSNIYEALPRIKRVPRWEAPKVKHQERYAVCSNPVTRYCGTRIRTSGFKPCIGCPKIRIQCGTNTKLGQRYFSPSNLAFYSNLSHMPCHEGNRGGA